MILVSLLSFLFRTSEGNTSACSAVDSNHDTGLMVLSSGDGGGGWLWLELELEPVDRECVGEEGVEEVVAVAVTFQTDGTEELKAIAINFLKVRDESPGLMGI